MDGEDETFKSNIFYKKDQSISQAERKALVNGILLSLNVTICNEKPR